MPEKLGVCAAEATRNEQQKFDLSESRRIAFFQHAKGSTTPEIDSFDSASLLPRRLLGEAWLGLNLADMQHRHAVVLAQPLHQPGHAADALQRRWWWFTPNRLPFAAGWRRRRYGSTRPLLTRALGRGGSRPSWGRPSAPSGRRSRRTAVRRRGQPGLQLVVAEGVKRCGGEMVEGAAAQGDGQGGPGQIEVLDEHLGGKELDAITAR